MPRARSRRFSRASPVSSLSWRSSSATGWPPSAMPLGQAQLHLEGHQLLLGAVVQVALEAPPFLVLGRDQPLARGPQLFQAVEQLGGEAHVAQHQPGLGAHVVQQLVLGGRQLLVARLDHGEGAEQFLVVADRHHRAGRGDHRERRSSRARPTPGGRRCPRATMPPARPGRRGRATRRPAWRPCPRPRCGPAAAAAPRWRRSSTCARPASTAPRMASPVCRRRDGWRIC